MKESARPATLQILQGALNATSEDQIMLKRFMQLTVLGLAVAALTPMARAQSETPLLIPFNTSLAHSDSHWILWMPTHPTYEAVEARSTPDPRSLNGATVQVFFTERAGGKNQVHYFNSEAGAKAFRGGGGLYRGMTYAVVGAKGSPQAVDIKFRDKDDRPVEMSMTFGEGQPLSDLHAGLANQMGHNRDALFLLFFREKAASALKNRIVIDGQDFSITAERATSAEQLSRTGYRSNVFIFTFPFGKSQYSSKDDIVSNSWRRTFKGVDAPGGKMYRGDVADGTRIEIMTTPTGDITEYRHVNGAHVGRIAFQPALSSLTSAREGQRIPYEASFDNFGVVVRGTALIQRSEGQIVINWQHESPEWTKGYHFQSIVQTTAAGYDLEVRKTPSSSAR